MNDDEELGGWYIALIVVTIMALAVIISEFSGITDYFINSFA